MNDRMLVDNFIVLIWFVQKCEELEELEAILTQIQNELIYMRVLTPFTPRLIMYLHT